MEPKPASVSRVVHHQTMMPAHSNPTWDEDHLELGAVNGGAILNLIDNVAGMAALRHCRKRVVTASIDRMDFLNPVHVGELLILKANVNYVGNTSLEVGVKIETENLKTGIRKKTGAAYLTFVCLDEHGKPTRAPPLMLIDDEDRKRYDQAKFRLEHRKELIKKQKQSKHFQ